MTVLPADTSESRVKALEAKLKRFTEYAEAHEKLEAAMLTDGVSWVDEMLEQFSEEFDDVQARRNIALDR